MNIIRTEQIRINQTPELSSLCHLSKNLYNEANYLIRQEFINNGLWIRYGQLCGILKVSENYKAFPAQSAQQTLKLLDKSWVSFFAATKEYAKHPEKFMGRPKMPRYKEKDGEHILVFTNQQVKIKDGILIFPGKLPLEVKTRLSDETNLREVRIIPRGANYICEIVYEKISEDGYINRRWYAKNKNIAGIDSGLRNVVTIANNIGLKPIVIKGGVLKSTNQFYNKNRAQLQSIYDLQGIKHGARMDNLTDWRNAKIKTVMHIISKKVVSYCVENNIGTIVIGKNDGWKQEANMGKKNNQNFVQIPHFKLIQMILYKAEEQGIDVRLQQESHTSKCSFLDDESVEHHEQYAGKRVSRGLFVSSTGKIINADVNGALNIIKKAVPNAFAKGIEGVRLHPFNFKIEVNKRQTKAQAHSDAEQKHDWLCGQSAT